MPPTHGESSHASSHQNWTAHSHQSGVQAGMHARSAASGATQSKHAAMLNHMRPGGRAAHLKEAHLPHAAHAIPAHLLALLGQVHTLSWVHALLRIHLAMLQRMCMAAAAQMTGGRSDNTPHTHECWHAPPPPPLVSTERMHAPLMGSHTASAARPSACSHACGCCHACMHVSHQCMRPLLSLK